MLQIVLNLHDQAESLCHKEPGPQGRAEAAEGQDESWPYKEGEKAKRERAERKKEKRDPSLGLRMTDGGCSRIRGTAKGRDLTRRAAAERRTRDNHRLAAATTGQPAVLFTGGI